MVPRGAPEHRVREAQHAAYRSAPGQHSRHPLEVVSAGPEELWSPKLGASEPGPRRSEIMGVGERAKQYQDGSVS